MEIKNSDHEKLNNAIEFFKRGKYHQTLYALKELEKNNNNFIIHWYLGHTYFKLHEYKDAINQIKKSIELNSYTLNDFRMILMGEGSKILDNQHKDKISFSNDIDFLEETLEDVCQSGLKFEAGLNKQEVVLIAKKQTKRGFFEKLFHFFQ